jgi:hypothetical protein
MESRSEDLGNKRTEGWRRVREGQKKEDKKIVIGVGEGGHRQDRRREWWRGKKKDWEQRGMRTENRMRGDVRTEDRGQRKGVERKGGKSSEYR